MIDFETVWPWALLAHEIDRATPLMDRARRAARDHDHLAETVLAYLLHFARGLDRAGAAQREGRWGRRPFDSEAAPVRELARSTVGVVGLGGIGREVAWRARALGADTASSAGADAEEGFTLPDPALAPWAALLWLARVGGALWAATRAYRAELQVHHGYLLVALTWTVLPAFAAVPLILALPTLSFTDAYFEAASAMTTTGATVLVGLDGLPASINVWRAMLQWLGGMGVVVLAVAILPLLGVGGRQVFRAETPGPMKDEKLTPRIAQTAKGLWTVYLLLTVLCVLAYRWGGMTWLDALIHAFTTLPLGGYSSHDASFAWFESPLIESIAVVFMLIAGVNFGTHFLAFRGRTLAPYRRDPEVLAAAGEALAAAGYAVTEVVSLGRVQGWPLVVTAVATAPGSDTPAEHVVWLREHLGELVVAGTRPAPPPTSEDAP